MAADATGLSKDDMAKAPRTVIKVNGRALYVVPSYVPRHDAKVAKAVKDFASKGTVEVLTVTPKLIKTNMVKAWQPTGRTPNPDDATADPAALQPLQATPHRCCNRHVRRPWRRRCQHA